MHAGIFSKVKGGAGGGHSGLTSFVRKHFSICPSYAEMDHNSGSYGRNLLSKQLCSYQEDQQLGYKWEQVQGLTILEHSIRMSTAQVGPQAVLHNAGYHFMLHSLWENDVTCRGGSAHRESPSKWKLRNSILLCMFVHSSGIPAWPVDSRQPDPHCTSLIPNDKKQPFNVHRSGFKDTALLLCIREPILAIRRSKICTSFQNFLEN